MREGVGFGVRVEGREVCAWMHGGEGGGGGGKGDGKKDSEGGVRRFFF